MEEAQEEQEEKKAEEEEIKLIMESASLPMSMVKTYQMCFDMLDADGGGSIDTDELRDGLALIKVHPSEEQLTDMMAAADLDQDGDLKFPAFVKLMCAIKSGKHKSALGDDLAPSPSYHYMPATPKSSDAQSPESQVICEDSKDGGTLQEPSQARAQEQAQEQESKSGPSKYLVSSPSKISPVAEA